VVYNLWLTTQAWTITGKGAQSLVVRCNIKDDEACEDLSLVIFVMLSDVKPYNLT